MHQLRRLPIPFFLALALAAIPSGAEAPDPEAKAALKKAVVFHREAKDLALQFEAEVWNEDQERSDKYRGKLLLKGADRFRLEIPGGTYVSDGKSLWEYHPKNKQAILRSASEPGHPMPGEVLLRFLDADPISVRKAKVEGKDCLELRLDPAKAMKSLDSLSVFLDRRDHSLKRMVSRDVSGNEARYTLVSVKRDGGIKDREFTFTPPKGVEVVDMR